MHIFRWDIDFQADSRPGDQCKIVFERRYADDRPNGYGRILFAVYDGKRTGRKPRAFSTAITMTKVESNSRRTIFERRLTRFGSRQAMVCACIRCSVRRDSTTRRLWRTRRDTVFAIASGTVTFQGCDNRGLGEGYGLYVCVRHDNGIESRYSHLSRIPCEDGSTDQSAADHRPGRFYRVVTGPHLFFEIIANGKRVDPTKVKMVKSPRAVPAPLHNRFKSIVNGQAQYFSGGTRVPPAGTPRTNNPLSPFPGTVWHQFYNGSRK